MTWLPVAAKGFDIDDVVFYLVVLIFGALAGLMKRAVTKARQQEKERRGPAARRPPRPPARPRREAPPPVPREAVVIVPPEEWVAVDVAEEVRRQQERLRQEGAKRRRHLETAPPMEADTAAIEARLLHIRPSAVVAPAGKAGLLAGLVGPDALRRAIIHYEVFAPPKALRSGPEPWEL